MTGVHEPETSGVSVEVAGRPSHASSNLTGGDVVTVRYDDPRALKRYTRSLALAVIVITMAIQATTAILLPNQLQRIEGHRYFTGADAHVDLKHLADLKAKIHDGDATVSGPHQAFLLHQYDKFDSARASALAVSITLSAIALMLVAIIVGVASDRTRSRRGRRAPYIIAGGIGGAALLVLLGLAGSVWLVALLYAAAMVAVNIALCPVQTTVAERVPAERLGKVSSVSGLGLFVGGVVGVGVAGVLFDALGLGLYGLFAALLLLGTVAFVRRSPDEPSTDLHVQRFDRGAFLRGLLIPLRAPDFRWVWIARMLLVFGYGVGTTLGFFILQSYIQPALSVQDATRLTPLLALTSAPATLVALVVVGGLSDRIGRRKIFVIGASLLMATSFLVPLASPTLPALFVQAVLAGLAFGIFLPIDQALFIEVLPDASAIGRDLGIATVATNLGQVVAPLVAAAVVAITGGYGALWVVAAALVTVAAFAILQVKGAR